MRKFNKFNRESNGLGRSESEGIMMITFKCPSCGAKLRPVSSMEAGTQIVRRTCRGCGERWQLVVEPLVIREGLRLDKATFAFLGRREKRR